MDTVGSPSVISLLTISFNFSILFRFIKFPKSVYCEHEELRDNSYFRFSHNVCAQESLIYLIVHIESFILHVSLSQLRKASSVPF